MLVKEMTPEALAQGMLQIATHPGYPQMGIHALETAKQFDVTRTLPRCEELF